MAAPQRISGLALASIILSCLSLVTLGVPAIAGVICGYLALAKCRQNAQCGGEGLARAGITIGYVSMGLMMLIVVVWWAMGWPT